MITEWILYIFLHGNIISVDSFRKESTCQEKKEKFKNYLIESNSNKSIKIWCQKENPTKLPIIIKND